MKRGGTYKELKPLPQFKRDYRGKNENGGRKVVFTTPPEYKLKIGRELPSGIYGVAREWGK